MASVTLGSHVGNADANDIFDSYEMAIISFLLKGKIFIFDWTFQDSWNQIQHVFLEYLW